VDGCSTTKGIGTSDATSLSFLDKCGDFLNEAEEKGKNVEEKLSLTDSYTEQFPGNIVEAEAA